MLDTHYGSFMSPSVPNGRDNRSKAPGESQGPFGMPNSFFGGAMPPSDKPRNPDWFKKREERLNPTINENGYLVKYVRENLNKFFQTEFPQLIREAIQAQNSQYQPQTPEQQPQPQQQAAAVPSPFQPNVAPQRYHPRPLPSLPGMRPEGWQDAIAGLPEQLQSSFKDRTNWGGGSMQAFQDWYYRNVSSAKVMRHPRVWQKLKRQYDEQISGSNFG